MLAMGLSLGSGDEDDSETIALFDEILRNEGDALDLFSTRQLSGDDSSSDDETSDD